MQWGYRWQSGHRAQCVVAADRCNADAPRISLCSLHHQLAAVAAVIRTELGTDKIPEVGFNSPTAPGVTHRYTSLRAYTDEIATARICAGFHYRNSTVVGTEMGEQIGEYVTKTVMSRHKRL